MLIDNLLLSVGAMKSGTTWMHRVLNRHPKIISSHAKEIHYFAHVHLPGETALSARERLARAKSYAAVDPESHSPASVRRRLLWTAKYLNEPIDDRWYADLFDERPRDVYRSDFSNLYAHLGPSGWDHVHRVAGTVRVIFTMRDPIERLWSHVRFNTQTAGRNEGIWKWTPEQLEAYVRRDDMWKHGEYGATIRRLREALSEQELRLFFFEDIHSDRHAWLRQMEEHLGLEPYDYPAEVVNGRYAESTAIPMPEWFPGLFRSDVERIVTELSELGLEPPSRWLSHFSDEAGSKARPGLVDVTKKVRRTLMSRFRA
ncbi:sulfotransferase [Jiella pacifica]|uniref:Sulfotransferase n=1 Tax=Jiella pacifica TaxID=2696469 RepID=A0A6N9T7A5_9HYPH|nr:sulfotransferase [Jiella pacifica]NDW07253.1 sulfotransferase [Jiella pacifica]